MDNKKISQIEVEGKSYDIEDKALTAEVNAFSELFLSGIASTNARVEKLEQLDIASLVSQEVKTQIATAIDKVLEEEV